jgi:chorismate dehydratase
MKVLFERRWNHHPQYVPEPPNLESMFAKHDAALLIGDPALLVDIENSPYLCVDLAREWQQITGFPFVFAFWAVRAGALDLARQYDVNSVFQASRDHGVAQLDQLSEENFAPYNVTRELARRYLSYHLDYALDEANLAGLRLFYRYAAECGALESAQELRFV